MFKRLFSFILFSLWLCCGLSAQHKAFTFAWLTDTHYDSWEYAAGDLRQAVADINVNDSVDFVVISGDLVEFGETVEYQGYKSIVDGFTKPCLIIPGNHDVGWSENGGTAVAKFFGTHLVYDYGGYRFIGMGVGPFMRMGPPCFSRSEIEWLRQVIDTTDTHRPIIFVNHYPMDEEITNNHEVMEILKKRNIQLEICGHEHVSASRSFEGIPVVVSRTMLRSKGENIGAYQLVTIADGKAMFRERSIRTKTLPAWTTICLRDYDAAHDTFRGKSKVSYSVNGQYPQIKEVWRINEPSDISAQGAIDGNFYAYTTINGDAVAVNALNGHAYWRYHTKGMIHSAPFITKGKVFVTSCDSCIYALYRSNGRLAWKVNTHYPIVACPLVVGNVLYIGSSNGKFYAFDANSGRNLWTTTGLVGFMESRPCADATNVYTGTWGAKFYAFNRKTGAKAWEFDTGRGRYFTPGACWPIVVGKNILMQSTDYFMRAFSADGKVLWQTDKPKGREAIAITPDKSTLFVQGVGRNITAFDITRPDFPQRWETTMPYRENDLPTRPVVWGKSLCIGYGFGVVYGIATDGSGLQWQHKISNSSVTSFCTTADGALIVMTMDGKIVRLKK